MYFRVNLSRDEHTARENGAPGGTLRNSVLIPKVYSSSLNCIITIGYRIFPLAATRQQPTTSSLRNRNTSSCMLTQVQTWLGITVTTSPTRNRRVEPVISRWPCSSLSLMSWASDASTTWPWPVLGPEPSASEERVFDPASIMARPGTAVETTVATTRAAQSSSPHAP